MRKLGAPSPLTVAFQPLQNQIYILTLKHEYLVASLFDETEQESERIGKSHSYPADVQTDHPCKALTLFVTLSYNSASWLPTPSNLLWGKGSSR